jgi:hypothetical protein
LTNLVDDSVVDQIINSFPNPANNRNKTKAFQAPTYVASQSGQNVAQQTYYGSGYGDSSNSGGGTCYSYGQLYGNNPGSGYFTGNTQGSGYSGINIQGLGPYPNCPTYFCFSADTMVRLFNGEIKRMDQLEVNDWVMSGTDSGVKFIESF